MAEFLLEVCVDSLHGALEAERGGAGRLELCGNLVSTGGVTPSYGLMKLVKSRVQIPVRVLVRPRAGDFVYSDLELDIMKADIDTIGQLGFQGVAIGALTPAREIDMNAMHQLLQACGQHQLAVTFHRAFDCVADPLKALQIITSSLGTPIDRILTSGQERTAVEGIPLLRDLVGSSSRICILPGAGITEATARDVVRELGVTELHGSVRKELHVSSKQSLLPGDGNSVTWTVDASQVQTIVRLCKSAVSTPNIIAN